METDGRTVARDSEGYMHSSTMMDMLIKSVSAAAAAGAAVEYDNNGGPSSNGMYSTRSRWMTSLLATATLMQRDINYIEHVASSSWSNRIQR